jgi:hypothetical protein
VNCGSLRVPLSGFLAPYKFIQINGRLWASGLHNLAFWAFAFTRWVSRLVRPHFQICTYINNICAKLSVLSLYIMLWNFINFHPDSYLLAGFWIKLKINIGPTDWLYLLASLVGLWEHRIHCVEVQISHSTFTIHFVIKLHIYWRKSVLIFWIWQLLFCT